MTSSQRESWDRKYARQGRLWAKTHDDWFEVEDSDLVLDLGSGTGKSSRSMKGKVVAFDFSINALKIASRTESAKIDLVCGDSTFLPFRSDSFDDVRISFLLDHLDEPARASTIDEAVRVALSGGQIAIESFSTADARNLRRTPTEQRDYLDHEGIRHHYFDIKEIQSLLRELSNVKVEEVSWRQQIGHGETMDRSIIRAYGRKK